MDLLDYSSSDEEEEERTSVNANATASASVAPSTTPVKTATNRGKKILALANVLPPHILEQLTRARGGDDDSEDDDETYATGTKAPSTVTFTHDDNDNDMATFLSELKSAPSSSIRLKTSPLQSNDKLGAAFVTATTTTKTVGSSQVINIHERQAPPPNQAPAIAAAPPQGFVSTMSRPVIAAAPRVSTVETTTANDPAPMVHIPPHRHHPSPPRPPAPPASSQQHHDITQKKRSRKEMEKALRAGNMAGAHFDVELEQVAPAHNVPQPDTYAAVPQHGIKVAPTAMYDPSSGQAVVGKGGGRGKNQINHLLASAANLELQRARQGGTSNNNNSHRAGAKQKYGW